MYYSVIGLLALTVLIITNHDVLLQKPDSGASPVQRIYRRFLFCIMAYYITDILWGVLDSLSLTTLLYADTVVYYLAMAAGILLFSLLPKGIDHLLLRHRLSGAAQPLPESPERRREAVLCRRLRDDRDKPLYADHVLL